MKAVLSATSFCGAVHLHDKPVARLLADLDCNGWPLTPRKRALEEIRRAWAVHLCGDQHLAVVTKQGIQEHGDAPYSFTSPALVNTIYPVVQVIEDSTGEILYTIRTQADRFHPRVYSTGKHTVMLGLNQPNAIILSGVEPKMKDESGQRLNVRVN